MDLFLDGLASSHSGVQRHGCVRSMLLQPALHRSEGLLGTFLDLPAHLLGTAALAQPYFTGCAASPSHPLAALLDVARMTPAALWGSAAASFLPQKQQHQEKTLKNPQKPACVCEQCDHSLRMMLQAR